MIKKRFFLLFLIIILLSVSVSVACDTDNITLSSTPINEDNIVELEDNVDNCHDINILSNDEENVIENKSIEKKYTTLVKSENQVKKYSVTKSNFNNYFLVRGGVVSIDTSMLTENRDNIYLLNYFPENITEFKISIPSEKFENNSMCFVAKSNITLNNCALKVSDINNNVSLENFNFNYDANHTSTSFINVDSSTKYCVLNNISVYVDIDAPVAQSYILKFAGKTRLENSSVVAKILESNIDWYSSTSDKIPQTVPVVISSSNCVMKNNFINVTSKGHTGESFYSLYGVYIGGDNLTFTNNTIHLNNATGYAYGFVDRSKNNTISDNDILVESVTYSAGVNIEGINVANNIVKNNKICVIAGMETAPWGNIAVAYAAEILDYYYNGGQYKKFRNSPKAFNNSFINNTITGYAHQFYGFEIYGGANTTISGNIINSTESITSMGIGVIGENVTMTNNIIEVRGKHNYSEGSADYIKPITAGIYTFYSSDNMIIANNNITTENGRNILTENTENVLIENNLLITENYVHSMEISGQNNTIQYNAIINEEETLDDAIIISENNTVKNNREPIKSELSITTQQKIFVNTKENINITLKDKNGNIIPSQYITVKIGDEDLQTLKTDEKGLCIIPVNTTTSKTILIHAEYKCYEDYGSIKNHTITIEKEDVKITYEKITDVDFGKNVTITGKFTTTEGKTITNSNVKIIINNKKYYAKTDNTGTYTLSIETNTVETNTVSIGYSGNTKYNPYEINTTFNVGKQDVKVTFDKIANVDFGKNVTITGKFTDSNGKAIANSNVKIFINGKKYYAKTDKNGKYTLSVATTVPGVNSVSIGYSGNIKYNSYEVNTTFNVGKQDVKVTYNKIGTVKSGSNITVTGKFSDSNGKAIANSNVKIILNGKKYYAKTDAKGIYSYTFTVSKVGVNNLTVGYSGNTKYNSYETNTTFTVKV